MIIDLLLCGVIVYLVLLSHKQSKQIKHIMYAHDTNARMFKEHIERISDTHDENAQIVNRNFKKFQKLLNDLSKTCGDNFEKTGEVINAMGKLVNKHEEILKGAEDDETVH